jgi:PTS system mannose-specific IID component
LGLYNTHPCWTPALVGLFLSLEERIARGLLAPQALAAVRSTVVFTLSGLGDAFFSGGVFVLWALVQCFLLVRGLWLWAGVWTVVALTAVQVMKMVTFFRAYSRGLAFLQDLKRWDLINWARHIKVVCAVALAAVVGAVAAPLGPWAVVLVGTGAGVSGLLAPGGPWRLVVLAGVGLAWIVGQWA